jgi:uncharacterized phiE125 gp8 family phage protein
MTVSVITPPDPVISWERAKVHLRQDSDDEKTYVEGLIAAATAWLDGPAGGWLGRALGPQLLEWRPPNWPYRDDFALPFGPALEVDTVEYIDLAGQLQTWAFSDPLYFEDLPAVRGRDGDIRIRYWAGYGKRDPEDATKWIAEVPPPITQAILLLVAQWFTNRSSVRIGDAVNQLPFAVEALLGPYKVWR